MTGSSATVSTTTAIGKRYGSRALWLVNLALVPGIIVMLFTLGTGYLLQLLWAVILAAAVEALCLHLRAQPRSQALDGSAVLTALLIALALPPAVSLWVLSIAVITAIGLAKQLFGGLGKNLFNPAMVGYALVLVSFPAELAQWPVQTITATASSTVVDALSAATPLELISHRQGQTFVEAIQQPAFGALGGLPWQWINLAFLAGGIALLLLRLARWRVVLGVLLGLAASAALAYDGGSSRSGGSVLYHWFSGATMLTAFFIATDPVTHPHNNRSQWLFGALVGVLMFIIRTYGSYPDGAAFAILLANAATPSLDHLTRRRFSS